MPENKRNIKSIGTDTKEALSIESKGVDIKSPVEIKKKKLALLFHFSKNKSR